MSVQSGGRHKSPFGRSRTSPRRRDHSRLPYSELKRGRCRRAVMCQERRTPLECPVPLRGDPDATGRETDPDLLIYVKSCLVDFRHTGTQVRCKRLGREDRHYDCDT